MTGTSYNGTIPLAAAVTGVKGLEAIIPVAPNTSYYHYYRSNGLVRHPGGWLGEDIDFLYDFINSGDPARREYCNRTYRDGEFARGRDRAHGDYNEFWALTRSAAEGRSHQGCGVHGARVQRLERRAGAQRPHLRGAQRARAVAGLLPPGRARRRAAARDDEQVVHALPVRRRERRRARAEGVDCARGRISRRPRRRRPPSLRRSLRAGAAAAAGAEPFRRRCPTRTIRIPTPRP